MKTKIFVSVVIPVKNGERTIKETLNSVLNQSYKNFEVIVVDDCSEDKTSAILKSFGKKIKIIRNKKSSGPAFSRNIGIKNSKGEIIFFTDADCKVLKDWITMMIKEYKNKKIAGVGGYLKPSKNNLVSKLELFQNRFFLNIRNKKIIGKEKTPMGYTNNVSYRKEALEEVKGFDESFPFPAGEDIDLKKRVCKKGYCVVYVPIPVVHLEDYDLSYLLNRIMTRGLNRKPEKSLFLKTAICFFGFPLITLNILRKLIKYKLERVI